MIIKFVGVLLVLIPVVTPLCIAPCESGTFCNDGDITAVPGSCDTFYLCVFNEWVVQECPDGTAFNISGLGTPAEECVCAIAGDSITCPYNCPTNPPLPEGPCDDATPCVNATRYPEQSNCSYYYYCNEGSLEGPILCGIGPEHGDCETAGLPCVFDLTLERCIHPDGDFDCETRCTREIAQVADMVENPDRKISCMTKLRVCDRPEYCIEGDRIVEPGPPGNENCLQYYECIYGFWQTYTCASGSQFDMDLCQCVIEGEADCNYQCEVTDPPPVTLPGPCDDDLPCVDGTRTPDRADCEDFHQCVDGAWERRNCIGGTSDQCDLVGYSCVYDVEEEQCIHPNRFFDCDPRCPNRDAKKKQPEQYSKNVEKNIATNGKKSRNGRLFTKRHENLLDLLFKKN